MLIDKKTLIKCKKGDRKAQKAFFECYAPMMMAICRRYIKALDEAEDVVQESFIKIFKNIKNFEGEEKIDFWVKRIVVNTALNSQRSKLYLFPMVDVEDSQLTSQKENSLEGFTLEDLYKMIDNLPTGSRIIFNLFAIEGYSHKEISQKLEISEGTSKSQYSRARQLLRRMIEKENRENYGSVRERGI